MITAPAELDLSDDHRRRVLSRGVR
ncbi:MAG: hypothetical protein QOK15_1061, partial [Nocardioidaceae bacterium]|nr:hypothetical protein [Nocardioidaceae bacterium]